jgi:hypothetical protein
MRNASVNGFSASGLVRFDVGFTAVGTSFGYYRNEAAPMCPACMTTAAVLLAGATSSGGVAAFIAMKLRRLRQRRASGSKESSRERGRNHV